MIRYKVQFKQIVEITAWDIIPANSEEDALNRINTICVDNGYDRFMIDDSAYCEISDCDVIECNARLLGIYN